MTRDELIGSLKFVMERSIVKDTRHDDDIPPSDRVVTYDGNKLADYLEVILELCDRQCPELDDGEIIVTEPLRVKLEDYGTKVDNVVKDVNAKINKVYDDVYKLYPNILRR